MNANLNGSRRKDDIHGGKGSKAAQRHTLKFCLQNVLMAHATMLPQLIHCNTHTNGISLTLSEHFCRTKDP